MKSSPSASSTPNKPSLEMVETPPPSFSTQYRALTNNDKPSSGFMMSSSLSPPSTSKLMSIDEAIEKIGMGTFQYRILVAAGLCFAADSMEVLLLSFLSVVLQAQWELTTEQASTMTSVVFLGALLGTLVLGSLGDRVGRKLVFWLTALVICVFGFVTAVAQNFWQLATCRFLVGFGVGGLTVPFDTLAEFVPDSHRGSNLLLIEYFWTTGTLRAFVLCFFMLLVPHKKLMDWFVCSFMILKSRRINSCSCVAMLTLGRSDNEEENNGEWRAFVLVCGIPCLVSCIFAMLYVPESPRWLVTQGRTEEALEIFRNAARINGLDGGNEIFPPGTKLVEDRTESENFADLFKPQWRWMTIFLWLTWAGFAFLYYGTIMTVTLVFASGEDLESQGMYSFDYTAILISASSELAGTTLVLLLVDRVGRVPTQVACYAGGGLAILVLTLLTSREEVGDGVDQEASRGLLIFIAFVARCLTMGASCTTWVSTAEILSTEIRTTGHSSANAVARLSGAFSPFLVTSEKPLSLVGSVMLVISLITAASSGRLPETKGKRLGVHPEEGQLTAK